MKRITITVEDAKVSTIVAVIIGDVLSLSIDDVPQAVLSRATPTPSVSEPLRALRPRPRRRPLTGAAPTAAGAALAAIANLRPGDEVTRTFIEDALEAAGYSRTSASPTTTAIRRMANSPVRWVEPGRLVVADPATATDPTPGR